MMKNQLAGLMKQAQKMQEDMKKAPLARRYAFKVVGRDGFEPS